MPAPTKPGVRSSTPDAHRPRDVAPWQPETTRNADRIGRAARPLTEALKSGIKDRGLTAYAVAKLAEVRPHVVQRFLNGERGLTLATADKLAGVLGLELGPREARSPDTKTDDRMIPTSPCRRRLRPRRRDDP